MDDSGPPATLQVFGFSWRGASTGAILSSQNFARSGSFVSSNTVFTGVPVGAANLLPGAFFAPQLGLANFGSRPANATVVFARTTDSGPESTPVAQVRIPAMSAQTVKLPLLAGDPGLRNSFIVQSDAAPGALIMSLAAVGAPGFGLVRQIGKDQQTRDNGGGHPWDLGGGKDAVLLLFNHSTVPKYFNVKIGNGGVLWWRPYLLNPMETAAISIRDLIASQVKDQDGAALPQNLEQGEIGWFTANPAEGKGRLMQIDSESRTVTASIRGARNFSCSFAYVLCGASVSPASVTFNDGATSSPLQAVPAVCMSVSPSICSGQSSSYNGLGYTYDWTAGGPAEVYGPSTESTATLLGAGSGIGYADVAITAQDNGYTCCQDGTGSLNVKPTVGIQVQNGFVSIAGNGLVVMGGPGGLTSTAITAQGNPGGGSVTWSAGPRLVISGVNSANASVSGTAPSASGGDTWVSVSYISNQLSASASARFTVENPTTLQTPSLGGIATTIPYTAGNDSGYETTITYYLYDQMSPANIIPVPGLTLTEVLSTTSNPFGAIFTPPDGVPRTITSNSSGAMWDQLTAVASGGLPNGFKASRTQNLTGNGYPFSPAQQQTYTLTFATVSNLSMHR